VSTDKKFAPKASDVMGLYLNPSLNAVVLSVDEIPSIQAIERAAGYVGNDSGKVARAEVQLQAPRDAESVCHPRSRHWPG
jgi:hypothetical protein